ncbi:MAG: hypothetical protein D6729_05815 [Deltaproteobacteria bacterium]|nr:MAG: hypothetical protein D6729_05815 [Deltaproteobacteria bacterium]
MRKEGSWESAAGRGRAERPICRRFRWVPFPRRLVLCLVGAALLPRPSSGQGAASTEVLDPAAPPLDAAEALARGPRRPPDLETWMRENPSVCVGAVDVRLKTPFEARFGDHVLSVLGSTARLRRTESPHPGELRFGVLVGIKEADPATLRSLDRFLRRFQHAGVDAVLVGGDTARGRFELERIFTQLAESGLPILAIPGNNESRTRFNGALLQVWRSHPNVVNMSLVRRVDLDGVDIVSLPGYHLRQFASESASCIHDAEDVKSLVPLAEGADDPVLLLTHGPPKQRGRRRLDFIPDAGNVGHALLTETIRRAGIRFGIHGHIVEAGATATTLDGSPVKQGRWSRELFLNPGIANSLPTVLNAGWTSYGTAAIVSVRRGKARWKLLRAPRPR